MSSASLDEMVIAQLDVLLTVPTTCIQQIALQKEVHSTLVGIDLSSPKYSQQCCKALSFSCHSVQYYRSTTGEVHRVCLFGKEIA